MGQELLKNLNEHEIGTEGFLGQYASQIVNNYFQRRVWLANLHIRAPPCVSIFTGHLCNLQSESRAWVEVGAWAVGCEQLAFSPAGPGALCFNEPR